MRDKQDNGRTTTAYGSWPSRITAEPGKCPQCNCPINAEKAKRRYLKKHPNWGYFNGMCACGRLLNLE